MYSCKTNWFSCIQLNWSTPGSFGNWFCFQFSSVQSFSHVQLLLRPHESQHARPPCPSPTPGVHSDSRPSSPWCHPAISSSVVPFSRGSSQPRDWTWVSCIAGRFFLPPGKPKSKFKWFRIIVIPFEEQNISIFDKHACLNLLLLLLVPKLGPELCYYLRVEGHEKSMFFFSV